MSKKSATKHSPPRDLLARAFLDILARQAGDVSKPLLRSGDPDDPIERLLDDLSTGSPETCRVSVRPDLAAAAVLTARAFETEPSLVRELRRGSPVVVIATHTQDLVALVKEVVTACAFGSDTGIEEARMSGAYTRSAVVFARDGSSADHKPEKGNDVVAAALHAGRPIVGVAADARRHLPRDLMRAAEFTVSLGQVDADALSLVIEAVSGSAPEAPIDVDLVRAADVSDLQLALRRDRTPEECLQRLHDIIRNRGLFDDGPRLEELEGYGEAKRWGLELAADLAAYRKGILEWSLVDPAALLVGPPGVGKTQFAKALARSAGVPLVATSVADWNSASYLSGTLQMMKNTFAQARRLAPSLLFIDELDGISDRARLRGEYVEYWAQIVNLLLELLQGVEERPGVVVVGATNHPDRIDAAVRRAGRLDRQIEIGKPGVEDLVSIFRFHLKEALPAADLMPAALAARGGTGADVQTWVRRAKGRARRCGRELSVDDLIQAVRDGREPLPPIMQWTGAVHEAGHVVVSEALGIFTLRAVAIDDAGGVTRLELKVEYAQTLGGLESLMVMLLAGRAAEELTLGPESVSAGAGVSDASDLARATRIAIDIETRLGLGAFGPVYLPERTTELILHSPDMINPVRHRLEQCLGRAREILAANGGAHRALADALQTRGYLDAAEIRLVLAPFQLQTPPASPVPDAHPNESS